MQSIAAESGPFFRGARSAFVHKIDLVHVLNERSEKFIFFLPRFTRLLGYAKSAGHNEGFQIHEGQDKGYKKINILVQSCQGIYFFRSALRGRAHSISTLRFVYRYLHLDKIR
jgi:hypothetical protein